MPRIPDNWPPALSPRRLSVEQAAYYVGLSVSSFRLRVAHGDYPAPRKDGRRVLWDRLQLDAAIDKLDGLAPITVRTQDIDHDEESLFLSAIGG